VRPNGGEKRIVDKRRPKGGKMDIGIYGMAALGVARADDEAALAEAGADLVVMSLDGVALDALVGGHFEPADVR
jgi:hypothetical protein